MNSESSMHVLPQMDTAHLDKLLLDEQGNLKTLPAQTYDAIPQEHIAVWCHYKGIYGLPTEELIQWLKPHVVPGKTIEIGAGVGTLGRALGIPMTDSKCMEKPDVKLFYTLNGQPVTVYPPDIVEMDAVTAVKAYECEVVLASWVTHLYREHEPWRGGNMYGIDEDALLDVPTVKKYIVVGNTGVHNKKSIHDRVDYKKYVYSYPWLHSRSLNKEKNAIYVWERKE